MKLEMAHMEMLGYKLMVLSQILSVIFPTMMAIDPDCNYLQQMTIGVTYYVYNPEYPNQYSANRDCRWQLNAPQGYVVDIQCNFEMPLTTGCIDDRVVIDRTGNGDLGGGDVYCGYGNKSLTSTGNRMSIALLSSYQSAGGRFLCSAEAKSNTLPGQCDCGLKNMRRIVGGTPTKVNEYQWMSALIDNERVDLFCGATIINNRYAVTAAHCFKTKQPSIVSLLVGDYDISQEGDTPAARRYRIIQFITHPDYDENTYQNDIGMVRTETLIEFNWAVSPVCLPIYQYQDTFAGQPVTALGWGTTEFTGPPSNVLLETSLQVIDVQTCYYDVNGTINQMCTFREGHDSCQKDSGGPLLWKDVTTDRYFLVGIISSGYGCAGPLPSINTRVTAYLMWILGNIVDSDVCIKQ